MTARSVVRDVEEDALAGIWVEDWRKIMNFFGDDDIHLFQWKDIGVV